MINSPLSGKAGVLKALKRLQSNPVNLPKKLKAQTWLVETGGEFEFYYVLLE